MGSFALAAQVLELDAGELPEKPDDLVKKHGYRDKSHPEAEKDGKRRFKNDKTGDELEYHKGKEGEKGWTGKDHYHRYNPERTSKRNRYLDKDGNPTAKGSGPSHLEPNK